MRRSGSACTTLRLSGRGAERVRLIPSEGSGGTSLSDLGVEASGVKGAEVDRRGEVGGEEEVAEERGVSLAE